jgi:hypothetical protein
MAILSNVFLSERSIGNIIGFYCWVNIHLAHIEPFSHCTEDCLNCKMLLIVLVFIRSTFIALEAPLSFDLYNLQFYN